MPLNLFIDFARRAANALNMPSTRTQYPKTKIEQWTVHKSPFVHKAKDRWERRTHYRRIQIFDSHPDVVDRWIYYVTLNCGFNFQYYFDRVHYDELGVGKRMLEETMKELEGGNKESAQSKLGFEKRMLEGTMKELESGSVKN